MRGRRRSEEDSQDDEKPDPDRGHFSRLRRVMLTRVMVYLGVTDEDYGTRQEGVRLVTDLPRDTRAINERRGEGPVVYDQDTGGPLDLPASASPRDSLERAQSHFAVKPAEPEVRIMDQPEAKRKWKRRLIIVWAVVAVGAGIAALGIRAAISDYGVPFSATVVDQDCSGTECNVTLEYTQPNGERLPYQFEGVDASRIHQQGQTRTMTIYRFSSWDDVSVDNQWVDDVIGLVAVEAIPVLIVLAILFSGRHLRRQAKGRAKASSERQLWRDRSFILVPRVPWEIGIRPGHRLVIRTLARRRVYYLEDLRRIERQPGPSATSRVGRYSEPKEERVRYRFVFNDHSFHLPKDQGKLVADKLCGLDPRIEIVSADKPPS